MNDIAKKATADKFLRALEKEQLSKAEAGACIGVTPGQVSCYFNEKYWAKLGIIYWDKLLAWANSGQSLKEYSEKHGKVLPAEKPVKLKITTAGELDPKAFPKNTIEASDIKSDPVLVKEAQKLKEQWDEAPWRRVPNEEVQKIRIDIEINLIINGQKIKLA